MTIGLVIIAKQKPGRSGGKSKMAPGQEKLVKEKSLSRRWNINLISVYIQCLWPWVELWPVKDFFF